MAFSLLCHIAAIFRKLKTCLGYDMVWLYIVPVSEALGHQGFPDLGVKARM